jgi:acyl-CoA thioesterase-1
MSLVMRLFQFNWLVAWRGLFLTAACAVFISMGVYGLNASEPGRILIIGDSITAGYNLPAEQAYPALLQEKIDREGLPFRVQNAGQSGDTTAGGLRRVRWLLRSGAPDVAVVALGGNDGLRGLDPAAMQSNLQGIVAALRESNPDVQILLAGMRMPESMGANYLRDFAAAFAAVVEQEGVHWLPFLLEGVAGEADLNFDDRIHPNADGQAIIAATVWKHLAPLLR